jgi:hypothetical protein
MDKGPWLWEVSEQQMAMRGCCPEEDRGCTCGGDGVFARLTPEDARRVRAGRGALLDLKVAVVRRLAEAARRWSADGLWGDCLMLLTGALQVSDVEFWLRMDGVFGPFDVREGILPQGPGHNVVGGLSALLRLIGSFEVNISVGLWEATRQAQECLPRLGRPASYFDLAGRRERARLDRALEHLVLLADRSRDAWAEFGHRVNAALEGDAWADLVRASANLGGTPATLDPAEAVPPRTKPPRNTATFPPLPDLRWDEVTIRFVSDTAVRIRVRDVTLVCTFAEAGFKDRRRAEKPDTLWQLLLGLARMNGELKWGSQNQVKNIGRTPDAVKKAVEGLRKRLCDLVGITEDPFHPYRRHKAYKVKFTLLDHDNYGSARPDEDDE